MEILCQISKFKRTTRRVAQEKRALLHRLENGLLRPIMYAASSFNDAERNYPQVEREALALVYAVKKFRHYIYGRRFELQTDHKPLLRIFGDKTGIPVHTANRLRRYALTLLGYDFTTSYIANENFAYADFVSRLINLLRKPGAEDIVIAEFRNDDFTTAAALALQSSVGPILTEDLRQATADCPHLMKIISYVESAWPQKKKQISDPEAAEYFTFRGKRLSFSRPPSRRYTSAAPSDPYRAPRRPSGSIPNANNVFGPG